MSNPLEKYLQEKNAGVKDIVGAAKKFAPGKKELLTALKDPLAVGAAGVGLGVAGAKALKKKDEGKDKEASFGSVLGKAKEPAFNAAVGAATMGGLTAGAAAVSFGAKKLYDAITKRRDFRMMLEHNPDLHEALERDPKFFNQAYSSLRSVNPQFASEPLIAGNYMRQMTESPLTAGGKLENAFDHASRDRGSPVLDAALRGAQMGLSQHHDPHAALENHVRGLSLQRKQHELSQPPQMDPHAGLEQEVRGLKLQRDKSRLTGP